MNSGRSIALKRPAEMLLAGRLPFTGANTPQIQRAVSSQVIPGGLDTRIGKPKSRHSRGMNLCR
ncbi:MAG: hypothetical protein ACTH3S_16375, partial [Marinobacter sp.]|uniref:hypothetical protein n=1 Tax=Marinobacter sp. TaxID=50741 RepID=UPI003F9CA455